MRMQRPWVVGLMVLLLPALPCSAQVSQAGGRRDNLQATSSDVGSESPREIRIFSLQYQQAEGLAKIIGVLVPSREVTIAVDGMSQNLIVPRRQAVCDRSSKRFENWTPAPLASLTRHR
jgi:hypothetical protein